MCVCVKFSVISAISALGAMRIVGTMICHTKRPCHSLCMADYQISATTYYILPCSVVKWWRYRHHGMVGFFANHHRQFTKGGPLWRHHRPQWHVYMVEFWPSAIDNTAAMEPPWPSFNNNAVLYKVKNKFDNCSLYLYRLIMLFSKAGHKATSYYLANCSNNYCCI